MHRNKEKYFEIITENVWFTARIGRTLFRLECTWIVRFTQYLYKNNWIAWVCVSDKFYEDYHEQTDLFVEILRIVEYNFVVAHWYCAVCGCVFCGFELEKK